MSFANIVGPIRRGEPVLGGFNILEGLRRFRQGLAYSRGTKALVGAGGVDVLLIGDSILGGVGGTFYDTDKLGNRLRQLLQARFNPSDIGGGYGFHPIVGHPNGGTMVWSAFGGGQNVNGSAAAWTKYGYQITGSAGSSSGICLRHQEVASSLAGSTVTASWEFLENMALNHNSQSASSALNLTAKQAQLVYGKKPGFGSLRFDFAGFATMPYASAQTGALTVSCDGAEGYGFRTGAIAPGTPKYLQATQVDANLGVLVEGALLYRDDFDKGIRLHDLCMGGAVCSDYLGAETLSGLARFGVAAGGAYATGAKLVILGFGTNECGTGASPGVEPSNFAANMSTLIQTILAWPSEPAILLFFPPCRNSANAQSRWRDYIEAGRRLCDQHNVAMLDFWTKVKDAPHGDGSSGYMMARGFYSDGVHYSNRGQDWFAQELFDALCLGA